MASGMPLEYLVELAKANPKDKVLKFIAEDHENLKVQVQCGNDRLLKITGPSHGYETHAPSVMVKVFDTEESAKTDAEKIEFFRSHMVCLVPEIWGSHHHGNLVIYGELPGFKNVALELIEGININKVALQKFAKELANLHNVTPELSVADKDIFESTISKSDTSEEDSYKDIEIEELYCQDAISYLGQIHQRKESVVLGRYSIADLFVKNQDIMVLDIEKTRIGPCVYDVAVLLGTLIKMYVHHMLTPEDNDQHRRVAYKLMDVCKLTVDSYLEHATWYKCDTRDEFIASFVSDLAVTTGDWLVRDSKKRPEVNGQNAEIYSYGLRLLEAYNRIHNMSLLLFIALQLC